MTGRRKQTNVPPPPNGIEKWNRLGDKERLGIVREIFGQYCVNVTLPVRNLEDLSGIENDLKKDRLPYIIAKEEKGYTLYRPPAPRNCVKVVSPKKAYELLKSIFFLTPPIDSWIIEFDGTNYKRFQRNPQEVSVV